MPLFDTHCHLQDPRLAPQLDDILHRAQAAEVQRLLCCATGESDWNTVLALARQYPGSVIPALGIHPWYAADRSPDWLARLRALLASSCTAVGEIGLDHALSPRNDADQNALFHTSTPLSSPGFRLSLYGSTFWSFRASATQGARRATGVAEARMPYHAAACTCIGVAYPSDWCGRRTL